MEYGRGSQVYEGQFLNGRLVVNGQKFETLSAAAKALAVTKEGKKATSLDGWLYWKVKLPGEMEWRSLGDMRGSNHIVLGDGDGSPPECSATIWMRRRRRSGIGFLTVAAVG
jgi:hypothetical protein